jgi:hypothetical protein
VHVLFEKLGGRFPENPFWSDTKYLGLSYLLDSAGQNQFRFLEVACSSTFVNLLAEDLFFDVPDPATIPQPWTSFASHDVFPLSLEAGRPLQALY